MEHKVRISSRMTNDVYDEGKKWLDKNVNDRWMVQWSLGGTAFITFENDEDRCLFILKYGEFIE